ncbi:GhoT/OrtT family toxin [Pectobacteriaceae bacterium CE70]|nr:MULTISPECIES: GhoT/OrtT family toxin [Enterobacterales]WJV56493.1 GhoT/OrtT family toxin [Pectobacteriaceae bacterium C111]WJV60908.1 GhoT/OrtT family toxin [Pectobacteriaceae bacterium C52]WJV68640.1 GhoT/OrtT family toxin [Pectobacteriaceae bacterium CE70]WJY12569.1 GhoT/OrtT family toxin [Pectobacteriaceae bacterium C80]WJY16680.1 GhoT/OrtT family toxin [Pectobacteriaceae bacterium CE90]
MLHHNLWEIMEYVYFIGLVVSMLFTFLMSRDNSLFIRFLAALIIGLTWPLSFPVVLVFSFF